MRIRLTNETYYFSVSLVMAVAVTYLHIMLMAYSRPLLDADNHSSLTGSLLTQVIIQHESAPHFDVVSGIASAPYQYRLFKSVLIETLMSVGLPFVYSWLSLTVVLSFTFFYLLFWTLRQRASLPFAVSGLIYFAFLAIGFSITGSFAEMLYTWIVYILVLNIVERDRLQQSTTGFILGCVLVFTGILNRESVIVIGIAYILYLFYILHCRRREGHRLLSSIGLLSKIAILCSVILISYSLPRVLYPDAPPYPLNVINRTLFGVMPISGHIYLNLTSPKILFNILLVFLLPAPFVIRGWTKSTLQNRLFVLTTICLLIPAYFVNGQLSEERLWSEVSLLTIPIFVCGAALWNERSSDSHNTSRFKFH